jgi:hypothetical protein
MFQKKLIYKHLAGSKRLLIVLDACRYDALLENLRILNPLKVRVYKVLSLGSCTEDWLINTFTRPINAVYISGNPLACYILKRGVWKGKKVLNPFKKVVDVSARFWDETVETVRAEHINLVAIAHLLKGENVIVHYMQPHAPFVTKTWLKDVNPSLRNLIETPVYELARVSKVAREEFKRAYVENLRYVLKNAKKLIYTALRLGYKVAITADHSELLGVYAPHIMFVKLFRKNLLKYFESWLPYLLGIKRVVGHPCGWLSRELYEVPWVEVIG